MDVVPGAMKLPVEQFRVVEVFFQFFQNASKRVFRSFFFFKLYYYFNLSLPEHSEDEDSRYKRDERSGVAGSVHLFEVGKVCVLKSDPGEQEESRYHQPQLQTGIHVNQPTNVQSR